VDRCFLLMRSARACSAVTTRPRQRACAAGSVFHSKSVTTQAGMPKRIWAPATLTSLASMIASRYALFVLLKVCVHLATNFQKCLRDVYPCGTLCALTLAPCPPVDQNSPPPPPPPSPLRSRRTCRARRWWSLGSRAVPQEVCPFPPISLRRPCFN
jgi:hypothetical protein